MVCSCGDNVGCHDVDTGHCYRCGCQAFVERESDLDEPRSIASRTGARYTGD